MAFILIDPICGLNFIYTYDIWFMSFLIINAFLGQREYVHHNTELLWKKSNKAVFVFKGGNYVDKGDLFQNSKGLSQ